MTAKEDYESQNKLLMEEMPNLYEGRIDYFQPSFQALIKSQVNKLISKLSVQLYDLFISSRMHLICFTTMPQFNCVEFLC